MSHFLVTVIGDDPEGQLAIYNANLPVETYKEPFELADQTRMIDYYGLVNPTIDDLLERLEEWCDHPGGVDENGIFYLNTYNPRAKWDWWIVGGRWSGYLKLKHGAYGELGKRGVGTSDEYPHGDLSADIAMMGDIDWFGMRLHALTNARINWYNYEKSVAQGNESANFMYGIPPTFTLDEYITLRNTNSTFAVVKNSDWFERGNMGWWGILLDASLAEDWEKTYDGLMSDVSPDTLITIVDCHI